VNRECHEACNISGMDIPEGVVILADVWSVHHDPDIWGNDQYSFVPERFVELFIVGAVHAFFLYMLFSVD